MSRHRRSGSQRWGQRGMRVLGRPRAEMLDSRILLATYYVSPAGIDTNPGTLGAPFGTIARGVEAALPGDSVLLRGGTYRETIAPVRSGLPGAPITIKSYNNEAVYVSASDVVDGPWTQTAPGSGIYTAGVSGALPAAFWSNSGSTAAGTQVTERGGSLAATVVNESAYSTTATNSIRASSVWNFFGETVTWQVRGMAIASTGSTALPLSQALAYFSIMPSADNGWSSDDSVDVSFNGNGNLGLLLKKNTVNSWGTSAGSITSSAITGFDLTLGPGTAGNVAYTLTAFPSGQTVATGQWAMTQAQWSDGGAGDTSYVQVFVQEAVSPAVDTTQKFELKVGSYQIATSGGTVLRDDFDDGDLATADYFPSSRATGISTGYDQVFVDGAMQDEARYANKVSADLLTPDTVALTMNNTYGITGSAFAGEPDNFYAGAHFLGRVGLGWAWQTAVVTSSTGSTLQLDPASASVWWWPNYDNAASNSGIGYLYGKLEFLDADREWYLQQNAVGDDTLYVRLAGGADPTGHVVEHKVRNWTVNINGYDNIVIDGLNLRGGAVRLSGSGLVLQDCDARYLSHYLTFASGGVVDGGLAQGGGVVVSGSNNVVRSCTIHDTAGSGIVVSGTGSLLTRNSVYNVDYSGTYGNGMELTGSDHTVTFNTIHDTGRNGLSPDGAGLTVMYNDVSRAGRMACDLGAIYTWGVNGEDAVGNRTRVAYNWVHDRGNPGDQLSMGIYLDNFARNFVLDHNVTWGIGGAGLLSRGIYINSPAVDIEVCHNTLIGTSSYSTSTYSSFPGTNPDPTFWTTANHGMDYTAQNNLIVPVGADPTSFFEDYAAQDFRPRSGTAAVNPTTTTGLVQWVTTDGVTNVPAGFGLYQVTPNQRFAYREVTGQGVVLPGINDGFVGTTPDSGAYEADGAYWEPGVGGFAPGERPSDIALSASTVMEHQPTGTAVGTLSTTDANPLETFTYTLVAGAGDADNGLFAIVGNELRTAAVLDFGAQSSCSIRICTTDSVGLTFEKVFVISVTAEQPIPVAILISAPNLSWRDLGESFAAIVVRFHSVNLDAATINGDEIAVAGPGGQLVVTLAGATTVDAATVDVTYHVAAPGGTWTGDDDGTYTVTALAGTFANMAGDPNALTSLGTFTAALSLQNAQTLFVNGTFGADTISVSIDDIYYRVVVNGVENWYPGNQVSGINVRSFAGNDTITVGPDIMGVTIDGGTGNDSITGGNGADSIRGDAGNDTIIGGAGDDTLMGNTEDDLLIGGDGADCLMGGLGADTLDGGLANDTLLGGDGRDSIFGGDGDDYIEGRGKMDTIYAGAGNDTIYGGAGSDLIYGEAGDDRVDVGISTVFHDTVDGGAGTDLVRSDSDDTLGNCEGIWPV